MLILGCHFQAEIECKQQISQNFAHFVLVIQTTIEIAQKHLTAVELEGSFWIEHAIFVVYYLYNLMLSKKCHNNMKIDITESRGFPMMKKWSCVVQSRLKLVIIAMPPDSPPRSDSFVAGE